ncbi:GMC family oxidoreductase N-terminal domain-containing protein [Candidatus Planktophila versatilis]|uniref:Choline dehydrogenase or related flavoprotein n=1 Tax=Candidatus Planktophila versatilis TaxID=1884905 RepID=A0ABM6MG15_9ACTN|nr:GMC family oxidoreductase N-terminal domain-containing protein [Candidatus Planktophila versatilis]ASY17817.1 Choline dehydrogenase or related flavoprotein [Candidatus Planktophila versatilis]
MIQNLVLGAGPVGIVVTERLAAAGCEVVTVDSGQGLPALRASTVVNSNVDFKNVREMPSLFGGSKFHWGGACMGFPLKDLSRPSPDSLMWSNMEPGYKIVSEMLEINGFDFIKNVPVENNPSSDSNFDSQVFELCYAYVVKDSKMKKNSKNLKSSPGVKFIKNAIALSLEDSGEFVTVRMIRFGETDEFEVRAKRVFVCLGTIETTRLLMNSVKSTENGDLAALGRNLSDHLTIKLGSVKFSGLFQWAPLIDYSENQDGSRLWPRWSISNQPKEFDSLRGFIYFTNINHGGPRVSFRNPRGDSEFYGMKSNGDSSKGSVEADINLFIESPNSPERGISLETDEGFTPRIPGIRIDFDISSDEWNLIIRYGKWLLSCIDAMPGVENVVQRQGLNIEDLQTSNHPSGTHPAEISSLPNVYPISAGILPRASATHPTMATLAIAVVTVDKLLGRKHL